TAKAGRLRRCSPSRWPWLKARTRFWIAARHPAHRESSTVPNRSAPTSQSLLPLVVSARPAKGREDKQWVRAMARPGQVNPELISPLQASPGLASNPVTPPRVSPELTGALVRTAAVKDRPPIKG